MAKKATKEETMTMMPMSIKAMNDNYSEFVDRYETSFQNAVEQSEEKKEEFVGSMTKLMQNVTDMSFQTMMPWFKLFCTAQISMMRFYEAQARRAEEMFTLA